MYFDTLGIFDSKKTRFDSIYFNVQTNCCILFFFPVAAESADGLCQHFEQSHDYYSPTVHAVMSSMFGISTPVKSRYQG